MFAANSYKIRQATDDDADALCALAERNSQPPLSGPVLIGETRGGDVAALSLDDGRAIADDGARHVVANLRVRSMGVWTRVGAPSLHDRMLAGLPAWYRAVSTPVTEPAAETPDAEQELVGAQA